MADDDAPGPEPGGADHRRRPPVPAGIPLLANTSAGRTVVRTLRILPPGALPATETADAEPAATAAPSGPVRTRETASDGYRHALAAHQAAKPDRQVDPELAAAYDRQTRALIAQRNRAFADQGPPPTSRT
ncbi:hypothetical protein [Streptomyces albidoflavus]|uniref:hypothetical protein n=1 Tax=Streptomyces albidoflavus TaxID=1886 RepID=UPI0033C7C065